MSQSDACETRGGQGQALDPLESMGRPWTSLKCPPNHSKDEPTATTEWKLLLLRRSRLLLLWERRQWRWLLWWQQWWLLWQRRGGCSGSGCSAEPEQWRLLWRQRQRLLRRKERLLRWRLLWWVFPAEAAEGHPPEAEVDAFKKHQTSMMCCDHHLLRLHSLLAKKPWLA
ncbi:hypothetical protein lerEdw1_015814 [Lerista edwardsae]|nr:hypothetical protein lerEdw1_015814 [Lerista edwardsae]